MQVLKLTEETFFVCSHQQVIVGMSPKVHLRSRKGSKIFQDSANYAGRNSVGRWEDV